jgi:alkylation response protein AidB-like acyl-CoA dehydrogenase
MDVRLSPEQRALRDAAAQVVDHLGPRAVGQLDDEERTAKLDAAVSGSGWRELRAPDVGDAPLASGVEVAILAEELARGLADTAFVGPTLAADLRRRVGAAPASEPETVLLTADLGDLAVDTDGAVAIDAQGARTALLLVDGLLGQVELANTEVRTDLTRPSAEPAGSVTTVPESRQLSADDLEAWAALGLALGAADLVGTMRGAVALACDYAKDRKQYGAPIGSFQAVQHLLADAFVAVEGSRSVALHAAWAVDALAPADALAAGSLAKAYAGRAARPVCETAIQVHGGIGNTWDCLAHVFLRRSLLSIDLLGGTDRCLARVLHHHGLERGDGLR